MMQDYTAMRVPGTLAALALTPTGAGGVLRGRVALHLACLSVLLLRLTAALALLSPLLGAFFILG